MEYYRKLRYELRDGGVNVPSWPVGTYWDQPEVKRTPQLSDLLEGRANGEILKFLAVIVYTVWDPWNCTVPGIAVDRKSHHG